MAVADGIIADFHGNSCEFVARWLRQKGLEGLIETFEGKLLTFL